jgi:hypothetical protein
MVRTAVRALTLNVYHGEFLLFCLCSFSSVFLSFNPLCGYV